MKKILLITVASVSLFASTNIDTKKIDLSWVDNDISAIIPKRVGIKNEAINSLHNPMNITFKKVVAAPIKTDNKKKPIVKVDPLKLKAIINSKALVGNKWLKVDDNIQGYTIKKITSDKVYLASSSKKKTLFLHKQNKSIKINTK